MPEGQAYLGSFPTSAEAAAVERSFKLAHGIAMSPSEGTLKSWHTRRLAGTDRSR
jgi:hypothetical protein